MGGAWKAVVVTFRATLDGVKRVNLIRQLLVTARKSPPPIYRPSLTLLPLCFRLTPPPHSPHLPELSMLMAVCVSP